jgi:hypothetical protein
MNYKNVWDAPTILIRKTIFCAWQLDFWVCKQIEVSKIG